ncbi:MAG: DUF4249 domain-containing protein [Chitinophagaceae bacterium]|nr:DUF4249 domain-containing protein [Chitinophagaceae bacterium]
MMKQFKLTIALCLGIILLSSCEKVIDIDLNNAEKKYVVEATISEEAGTARVRITQTVNFDESNYTPGINGATVTISDNLGNIYDFTDNNSGTYSHGTLVAVPGRTYTLNVQVNSETFTAVCKMPEPVDIDSLFITDELLFGEYQKTVNVLFQDPPGRGNAYRFHQVVNGLKEMRIMIMNDDYSDGRLISSTLFYFVDEDAGNVALKSGDEVEVTLQAIDAPVYKYWFSLDRSASGGNQQAAPSNPVSNIRGGALGYFSAHAERTKTIVVP